MSVLTLQQRGRGAFSKLLQKLMDAGILELPQRFKLPVEQIPQIVPCATDLTIVLRNTDFAGAIPHRLLYNPPCAAACRRLV